MFELFLPPLFGLASVLYLALAVYVSRTSPQSIVGFFLLFIGIMMAGTAFSYGATDPTVFGIGRVLTFFGAGFLPLAFFCVYKQYTDDEAKPWLKVLLAIIPAFTTLLAATNSWHYLVWATVSTPDGVQFTNSVDHLWFKSIHAPFSYGLFLYALVALSARLSSIALAHRRTVIILLVCAAVPLFVSIGNNLLGIGPIEFPFTASAIVLLLPLHLYAALSLRVFEFSPLGYQTLFNHVRDPIVVLDDKLRIVCANKSAGKMLGKTEKQLLGQYLMEDFPEAKDLLRNADSLDLTQTLKMDDDHVYEVSVAPLSDQSGRCQGTVVMFRDVTQKRRTLSQLADNEHLIRTLIETSSNGILRFAQDDDDEVFRCIFANQAAENILTGSNRSLVGMRLEDLELLKPGRLVKHFTHPRKSANQMSFETSVENDEGNVTWLRVTAEPVGSDFSVTMLDITQRKHNEDMMLEQALRDPLTGVLNRRGFESTAQERLRKCDTAAVLYLDLNEFKQVNDRFGHQAGDALLKAFGHRLGYCLRPEDVLGRLGGDEFAIVLPDLMYDDVQHVVDRLEQTGKEAYVIQGKQIHCSTSVGIALMPDHGEELWHLVSVADQAMYSAKSGSSNDDDAGTGFTEEANAV